MKKLMKANLGLGVLFLFMLMLAGCKANSIDDKKIVVAASETPHAEILEQTRSYLEAKGYTLEIRVFGDYVIPNNVTETGEVDANFFQHLPYLTDFNLNNHTNLVSVYQVHFEPLGLYQGKRTSLDDLEGAKIGIANDNSNGARGLLLLESEGIIGLDSTKGTNVTVHDILSNPYHVQIVELEAAVIPAQLEDLDFAVINGNYALSSSVPSGKLLASESKDSEAALLYSNIIVVKKGNEKKPTVLALIEALSQPSISEYIRNTYQGVVVPIH